MSKLLHLTYIGHATVLIQMDGVRLLTDPLLRQKASILRRRHSPIDQASYQDIDAVLISHLHLDHLDLPSLQMLDRRVRLIVPNGANRIVNKLGFENVREMHVGDTETIGTLSVKSTHAEHRRWRYPFGLVADCMGFVISGQYRIYFSGDTDIFPGMAELVEDLDIALLSVWGWGPTLPNGHMSPKRAAQALTLLHPYISIPIHWGTMLPLGLGWMRPRFFSQPPLDFARYASQLAPKVEIQIVSPGSSIVYGRDFHDA